MAWETAGGGGLRGGGANVDLDLAQVPILQLHVRKTTTNHIKNKTDILLGSVFLSVMGPLLSGNPC